MFDKKATRDTYSMDYDEGFFKKKVKEALLIRQKNNFNQDSGLAVSLVWLSLYLHCT